MKPLKILLGNNSLSLLAGSETWTYALALQLKAMGHDVSCYAPELGVISDRLIQEGISCYSEIDTEEAVKPFSFVLEEPVKHEYDVIISNHFHVVEYLRSKFSRTPIISTVHGVLHFMEDGKTKAPEHPSLEAGVAQFVAVSEEVQKKLQEEYNIDSVIIRNFFDIKKLGALKPAAEKPRQFLLNTNYSSQDEEIVQVVKRVSKHFGARFAAVGQNFAQSFDLSRAIEDSDVVFGMGRSVLEGVAAGRLGIVHGRWGTGGVVCESNLEALRYFNFSGRNSGDKLATEAELIETIERYYRPDILEWGKGYAARDHNVVFAADEYVRLARGLTGELIVRPLSSNLAVAPDTRPFRLAKDVQNHES